jgi:hypothetical protein
MPNNSGIDAKGISSLRRVFFTVAMPITVNKTPAVKLAVAEKHIVIRPFVIGERAGAMTLACRSSIYLE